MTTAQPSQSNVSLAELREGEHAVLETLEVPTAIADHLMCLGFVPGVEVTAGKTGLGGDPRVFHVDGTDVALRRDTSSRLSATRISRKQQN